MNKFVTRFTRSAHPKIACTMEERRTKSEFKDECDINLIMARYKKTGILPQSALSAAAQYGDFSQLPDYMEMRHKIIAAEELFAALPSDVRKQFDNDPGLFIDAADTPEGRALMIKLGLGKKPDKPVSSPQEPLSTSGGGQPPKTSPKIERKPNQAQKAAKTEESSQDSE